jgi:hypothetical protein
LRCVHSLILHKVALLEKNGLRHGEVDLKVGALFASIIKHSLLVPAKLPPLPPQSNEWTVTLIEWGRSLLI